MFFFVGDDLEGGVDAFSDGGGFEDVADGAGCEAVFADEDGDVLLGDDEAESDEFLVIAGLGYSELGLVWLGDELQCDELEEVAHLFSDFLHLGIVNHVWGSAMIIMANEGVGIYSGGFYHGYDECFINMVYDEAFY